MTEATMENITEKPSQSMSVIGELSARLSDPVREFVTSRLGEENLTLDEQKFVNLVATKLQTTILDSWTESEEWEMGTAALATEKILWGACDAHPSHPIPGPDPRTEELVKSLAEALSFHVAPGDIDQLAFESRTSAALIAEWCKSPSI